MKVLKFVPAFSRSSQTFIYGLACGLRDELRDFRVLTLERENAELRPFDAVDLLDEVTQPPDKSQIPLLKRIFGDVDQLSNSIRFAEYLKAQMPDLVHAHFGPAAAMIVDACETHDIPLVVSLRGYDASRLVYERKWQKIYADLFPRCHTTVLITDEMRERIEPFSDGGPMVTIHAGKKIDDYPFVPPGAPARRFLSIGRLVEKKGHADAIRAIGEARREGADVSLRIVGGGEERDELQELIDTEKLSSHVELVGRLAHDDVKAELRDADAFILACRTASNGDKEGIPNVLKESQLMGLPVISTRHAGVPDAIPEENHRWLAAEGDISHLSRLVAELHRQDEKSLQKMANAARRHVAENFSRRGEVARYLELYSEITGSNWEPSS